MNLRERARLLTLGSAHRRALMWIRAWFPAAALVLWSVTAAAAANTQSAAPQASALQENQREERCKGLGNLDLSQLLDAPTQITGEAFVSGDDSSPRCDVTGYVAPNVGFLLRLPADNWNGKLVEIGCGGFCGVTDQVVQCDSPIRRNYACIVTDEGHKSTPNDTLWAFHNLQAGVDYAYRASHVTALAGKAIAAHYYSHSAQRSYFIGCSSGGREAMVEAQHFPWDFDGIVAGAPSLSEAGSNLIHVWWLRALTDESHKPLFTLDELRMVHAAVLKKCDMDDGIRDGIISNPASCQFDPISLQCKRDETTDCLSQVQVNALIKVYAGPMTSGGYHIYPGRAFSGSELNLPNSTRTTQQVESEFNFLTSAFRYSELDSAPAAAWKTEQFDFDKDYKRLGESDAIASERNPDLRAFRNAGGKLISYVGLNDIDQADVTMDYYNMVERVMGGRTATQQFFRLFVIPGMNHCIGGDGAFDVDYLTYLDAWVEHGQAPDKLLSFNVEAGNLWHEGGDYHNLLRRLAFPLDQSTIAFSRPIYPYPLIARYRGQGDPANANSYEPAEPDGSYDQRDTMSDRVK